MESIHKLEIEPDSSVHLDLQQDECPICYEVFDSHGCDADCETASLHKPLERLGLFGCKHEFCRECLTNHCKHSIAVRDMPIRCPANASEKCENILKANQVKDLLCPPADVSQYGSIGDSLPEFQEGNAYWNKFQRLQKLYQDPSLIPCVRCVEPLSKEDNLTFGGHEHQISCPSCGHSFCSVHGDAHPGISCKEYKPDHQTRKSEKAIRQFTKPCSHCGAPIEKESGCDHIVCVSCKKDMCFRCGTHLHLTGEMIRSCRKCDQSYIDHRYIWRYRLTLCFSLPLYIPICIVHMIVVGAITLATCCCFCCLGCGMKSDPKGALTFDPLKGTRTVLGMLLLPAIDLVRQCGFSCCCGIDIPGIESSNTPNSDIDDSDDEGANDVFNP